MAAREYSLTVYQEAVALAREYVSNYRFRQEFEKLLDNPRPTNPNWRIRSHRLSAPLFVYTWVLSQTNPNTYSFYGQPSNIKMAGKFFYLITKDEKNFNKLIVEKGNRPGFLPLADRDEIDKLSLIENDQERDVKYLTWYQNKTKKPEESLRYSPPITSKDIPTLAPERPLPPTPQVNTPLPGIKPPSQLQSLFKSLGSRLQIQASRLASRFQKELAYLTAAAFGAGGGAMILGPMGLGVQGAILGGIGLPASLYYLSLPDISQKIGSLATGAGDFLSDVADTDYAPQTSASSRRGGFIPSLPGFGRRRFLPIPWIWIIIIIIIVVTIALIASAISSNKIPSDGKEIEVILTGPSKVENKEDIFYSIEVRVKSEAPVTVRITDPIPQGAQFKAANVGLVGNCNSMAEGKPVGNDIIWTVENISASNPAIVCLTLTPESDDIEITNSARAEIVGVSQASGDLEIKVQAPEKVEVFDVITYIIDVYYKGAGTVTVDINNPLPENTTHVSSISFGNCDSRYRPKQDDQLSWGPIQIASGQTETVCLTVKPGADQIKIANKATVKVLSLELPATPSPSPSIDADNAPTSDGDESPSDDTCGGKYAYTLTSNLSRTNFGDPVCSFTKDGLYELLQKTDPTNADFWYYKIVPCESSYNPNITNAAAVDPGGAWGLYQMGRGRNGIYDHGDVAWQKQTTNALSYYQLNLRPRGYTIASYWQCAR